MPTLAKRLAAAFVLVLLLIAMNSYMSEEGLFGFGVPPYYARVIMLAGINVILAVSLNLITGFTGQFSIGHAGFMAVGAYSSAYLTVYYAAVGNMRSQNRRRDRSPRADFSCCHTGGRDCCGDCRVDCRYSFAAIARRLPGHRDPRFC